MKTLARSYIWWPGSDQDLEQLVKHVLKKPNSALETNNGLIYESSRQGL